MIVVDIVLSTFAVYLGIGVLYYALFAFASWLPTRRKYPHTTKVKTCIFIPAYKEDRIIIETVRNIVQTQGLDKNDKIVVIADQLKEETLSILKAYPIEVIKVQFEKSTKAKSLNFAMQELKTDFDLALILDADNWLKDDCLQQIKNAYAAGNRIIQAHRTAKNTETPFAMLDAISEEIANSTIRKGQVALGLSSAIIGSGMAFDYKLFKQVMSEIDAISGFDKELEVKLLKNGYYIQYLEDAYVLDEKVSKSTTFKTQRTRWIFAQINYAKLYGADALWHLLTKGNIEYANKVLQFWLLPRLILLAVCGFFSLVGFFINQFWFNTFSILFTTYLISLFLAVPIRFYHYKSLIAFFYLPIALIMMILAFLQSGQAKKKFLHTEKEFKGNS